MISLLTSLSQSEQRQARPRVPKDCQMEGSDIELTAWKEHQDEVKGLLRATEACKYNSRTVRVVFDEHLLCSKWAFLTVIEQPHGLQPDRGQWQASRQDGVAESQIEFCPTHLGSYWLLMPTPTLGLEHTGSYLQLSSGTFWHPKL